MSKRKPAPTAVEAAPLREPDLIRLKVSQILPWDGNPRDQDAEQIRLIQKSMEHYGIVSLPVVQAGTNRLIAGHGRIAALKAAGRLDDIIPVLEVELSDEDAMGYAVVDNRLTDLSTWNLPALKAVLVELDNGAFDVELTGFTPDALGDLFPVDPPDDMGLLPGADPESAPACPETPFLRIGDLVLLGRHRLLVGDSTNPEDVRVLMDGAKADLVVTDPPYNVAYESSAAGLKADGKSSIQNDSMSAEAFQSFLDLAFARYAEVTGAHAAFYVFYPSRFHIEFEAAMLRAGITVRAQIIWAKNAASFGFAQYKWKHEPVLLGAKAEAVPLIYVPAHETAFYAFKEKQSPFWTGDRSQTTVWSCARETGYRHPTQKPVELLRKPITNSSKPGMLVLDLFGGSGSTLIACEAMGRRCNTMELDPKFGEVILRRWEEATGKNATAVRDGEPLEVPRV